MLITRYDISLSPSNTTYKVIYMHIISYTITFAKVSRSKHYVHIGPESKWSPIVITVHRTISPRFSHRHGWGLTSAHAGPSAESRKGIRKSQVT